MPETSNDEALEYLVQKVEETGVSPMVTLMIGGLVVVGGLVRSKLYYDYLSGLFDTFTDKEGESKEHGIRLHTKDPIELETLGKYFKDWKESMTKLRDKKDKDNNRPTYIHLYNVQVWEVFSTEPFRFEYWRGKISSIDGFYVNRESEDNQLRSFRNAIKLGQPRPPVSLSLGQIKKEDIRQYTGTFSPKIP